MSKFIVVSDIHFHNWRPDTQGVFPNRLAYQRDFLKYMGDYAEDNDIRYIFNCGDTFHIPQKLDVNVVYTANDVFTHLTKAIRNPLISLTGNHDRSSAYDEAYNSVLASIKSTGVIVSPVSDADVTEMHLPFDFKWVAIPYTTNKDELNATLKRVGDMSSKVFLFMHQGVANVPMGSGFVIDEIFDPNMIPKNVIHAFTGHYHSHRRINSQLTVVGSPMQHTKADEGEDKGFLVVDSESGEYEMIYNNESPKFRSVPWEFLSVVMQMNRAEVREDLYKCIVEVQEVPLDVDIKETKEFLETFVYSCSFTRKELKPIDLKEQQIGFDLDSLIVEIAKDLDPKYREVDKKIRLGEYEV